MGRFTEVLGRPVVGGINLVLGLLLLAFLNFHFLLEKECPGPETSAKVESAARPPGPAEAEPLHPTGGEKVDGSQWGGKDCPIDPENNSMENPHQRPLETETKHVMESVPTPKEETSDVAAFRRHEAMVFFDLREVSLTGRSQETLKDALQGMGNPANVFALVEGHADPDGPTTMNHDFGWKRSREVASFLENLGVPTEQIITRNYGEGQPIIQERSSPEWWKNRRVLVNLVQIWPR
ncbi:MAG: OmpA family protein [Nitrospirae bacterium]|nr:OmpA family protein [Magnetococcales bacterium]HAT50526.1 hypothetical protein [Alphaproteobacteria bacterium]